MGGDEGESSSDSSGGSAALSGRPIERRASSCTRTCRLSVVRRVNILPQPKKAQRCGRLPECVRLCRASEDESPKLLVHPGNSQRCGRSPVCTRLCTVSALRWMNVLPHPGKSHS